MPKQTFYIGPYESGLVTAVRPFLLPDEAFALLKNAYVYRGHVKKRIGSRLFGVDGTAAEYTHLLSRLRIKVDTTGAGGNAAGVCPGAIVGASCIGQMFSIGTEIYTVYQATGVPANMLSTGTATTYTHDSALRAYNFIGAASGAAGVNVYWYPAQPVMGFISYESPAISDEPVFAFDQQFSYQRAGNGWDCLDTAAIWTGSNSQFFWGVNFRGVRNDDRYLFVVNNNRADRIKYWTGGATWAVLAPQTLKNDPIPPGPLAVNFVLHSARLVVSFKNRLVFLNTLETIDIGAGAIEVNFANRARWSQNGDPTKVDAFYEDVAGKGSWIGASTKEAIITAQILKDRLIVYFEHSTWELVYTNNKDIPFIWQNLDDKLGAESTFSSVLFDKVVLGIGNVGIHACDGLRVTRIDEKIPDDIHAIHNGNEGVERVAGIRDFSTEMIYWTLPSVNHNTTYPDRMLIYNYRNGAWAYNDDSITAFGYYQNVDDETWGDDTGIWEVDDSLWVSATHQSEFKNVIAGNQEGFTFICDKNISRNAPALYITDITIVAGSYIRLKVINHNLHQGDYVLIENILPIVAPAITNLNGYILPVLNVDIVPDTIDLVQDPVYTPVGTYIGGGTLTRINKMEIKTKQFNFYSEGMQLAINKVSFDVNRTVSGKATVSFYSSSSDEDIRADAIGSNVALGTYVLDTYPYDTIYPLEATQNRLIHPVYIQSEGDCIQLHIFWDDDQLRNVNVTTSPFELNSMTFYASPTTHRL